MWRQSSARYCINIIIKYAYHYTVILAIALYRYLSCL